MGSQDHERYRRVVVEVSKILILVLRAVSGRGLGMRDEESGLGIGW